MIAYVITDKEAKQLSKQGYSVVAGQIVDVDTMPEWIRDRAAGIRKPMSPEVIRRRREEDEFLASVAAPPTNEMLRGIAGALGRTDVYEKATSPYDSPRWVKVYGYDVYVDERNRVRRATKLDHNGSEVPAAPYRWDTTLKCHVNATGCTLAALRSGMRRGTYTIQ